jgi:hypothetical protein
MNIKSAPSLPIRDVGSFVASGGKAEVLATFENDEVGPKADIWRS